MINVTYAESYSLIEQINFLHKLNKNEMKKN